MATVKKSLLALFSFLCFGLLICGVCEAESLLRWQIDAGEITGYKIYYSTSSGSFSNYKDVGNVQEYPLSSLPLVENETYYIIVRAYNSAGDGDNSNEVVYTVQDETPPSPPQGVSADATTGVISWSANMETDLKEYRVYYGTSTNQYNPFIPVGKTTQFDASNLQREATYHFAVTAVDLNGNESGYSAEVQMTLPAIEPQPEIDPTDVTVNIAAPTNYQVAPLKLNDQGDTYYIDKAYWFTAMPEKYVGLPHIKTAYADRNNTAANFLSFNVDVPVNVYVGYHEGATAMPQWLQDTFTDTGEKITGLYRTWNLLKKSYPSGTITLGGNKSDGGNASETYIVVVEAIGSVALADTVSPTVTISSPTTASNYTTDQATLALSGTASDNIGVLQVTWSNSAGGSGIASGTLNWSTAEIALNEGENVITVQAADGGGNINGRILVVTYTPPDTESPAVAINSPINQGTFTTQASTIDLSGIASDNVGVTQVAWSNSQGGNDIADGNESWTAQGISLAEGDNIITVTAADAAGNEGKAELTVTYTPPDVIEPSVQILSPTSDDVYSGTASTIDLSGTAADNTGISQVTWSNSRGGSGIASGTSDWSITGIGLYEGENLITVTAQDAAGNSGVDSITVHYAVADTIAPSIKMTSPTAARFYYTKDKILDISGIASDNKGVAEVVWENSKGGGGRAAGTENWSISGIELSGGRNTITITAIDVAGNKTSIRLYVVYR